MATRDSQSLPFRGCGTALITPFADDQSLDEAAFRSLIRRQIAGGVDFLVPCGTTGETPTLTEAEHLRVVEIAVEEARPKNVPVLAGAGSNNTAHAVALSRELEAMGVDGILSVAPYYNKPTQAGLYAHFAAVAEAVKVPVVLYNVPGRTGSNIEAATALKLAQLANVVAVKEASGNLAQISAILAGRPQDFSVLSGDDAITLPLLALGGQGVISVASNAVPEAISGMVKLGLKGDIAAARAQHFKYLPLMEALFVESNPAPVKYVMARLGLCREVYRLPMVPLQPASRARLDGVLAGLGL